MFVLDEADKLRYPDEEKYIKDVSVCTSIFTLSDFDICLYFPHHAKEQAGYPNNYSL